MSGSTAGNSCTNPKEFQNNFIRINTGRIVECVKEHPGEATTTASTTFKIFNQGLTLTGTGFHSFDHENPYQTPQRPM